MTAPKRRSTHLELVDKAQGHVDAAIAAHGKMRDLLEMPVMPRSHVKALAFLCGSAAGLLVAALIIVVARWAS